MSEHTVITHEAIAEALRTDPSLPLITPTEEQRRIIEAPHAPSLVVAGAGSGKTQTMVQRMVWLVAREGVSPSELLGLTFTRKAAGELRERVDDALRRLRAAGLVTGDESEMPEVSTYNSFAHRIYQEHALLIGREPDSALLDEAAAFTLMRRVALRSDDPALGDLDVQLSTIVENALDLSREMRDNGASIEGIERIAEHLDALLELPVSRGNFPLAKLKEKLDKVASLRSFARLALEYEAEKRARGLIEFSDQVAGTVEICERAPEVIELLRDRHRHVILDEYQDTSVGQTRMLSLLFRGTSLMAVGDPKQSIYGWRGASAANMSRFARDFDAADDAVFTLSTSWRNDRAVLDAANTVAVPLVQRETMPLPELGARPGADDGTIVSIVAETLDDEIAALADVFADVFATPVADGAQRPTAAILFRTRSLMSTVARALADRGVPARIIGLGGLLSTPEITDLIAVLRAARDPSAGSDLIRLLVGARAQIGAADIAALHAIARSLARASTEVVADDGTTTRQRVDLGTETEPMLSDAVAFVASKRHDHPWLAELTPDARVRTTEIASLLDDIRDHAALPLVDIVEYAIRRAGLDLETAANPNRVEAHANLDAFLDHVVGFQSLHGGGADLGALLDWVESAQRRDDLTPAAIEPEPGAVQLLTIHGAKGLEWDLVAVPRLVTGGLPSTSREGLGWVKSGKLPYPLRLDAGDLPSVSLLGHETQNIANKAFDALGEEVKQRFLLEERRLAYVAFTRARSRLVLTASYWGAGVRPFKLSPYLLELVEAGLVPEPPPQINDERPDSAGSVERITWPREPMRERDAETLRKVAADVREAMGATERGESRPSSWDDTIDLLLRERDQRAAAKPVEMPARLAASHFKDLVLDPAAAAAQWRRPMPQRPFRQTRLGTMFHAWVEQRSGAPAGGGDLIDGSTLDLEPEQLEHVGVAAPTTADEQHLRDLQARFERSPWASRRPIAVEQSIELPLGRRTVVCKLDAVYETDDGTIEVVDWKTGAAPRGRQAEWERQLQLALYTLAYSRHHGVPPERIQAVLYYVADGDTGTEYRFDAVTSEAELQRLLAEAEAAIAATDDATDAGTSASSESGTDARRP